MLDTTENKDPTDDEIQGVVDGTLDPHVHAELAARIAEDPALFARVDAYITNNNLLREAADALASPRLADPTTAQLTALLAERLEPRLSRRLAYVRNLAAGVALVATGWLGALAYGAASNPYPDYVADAVGAHAVFAEDRVYPAEFRGEGMSVAAAWFAEKLGRGIAPPSLDALGLELVGARMLGGKEGPLAQFVYEDREGNRISLVMKNAPVPETRAPIYRHLADTRASYWSEGGLDYAMVSRLSDPGTHQSATEISRAIMAHMLR